MTADQAPKIAPITADAVEYALLRHLADRTRVTATPDQDLFASGVVSSMFAMELVVYLEQSYQVVIIGGDLKLDNFRTVRAMTDMVLRLREASGTTGDA